MISWAQNLEDVMLARAFHDRAQGFYVDVGAFDPDSDSVTRHFYDRGWRGINIDPVPAQIERFHAARPRDINLGVALGECAGSLQFFDFSPAGLSTLDADVARDIRARGFTAREIDVPVMR
ncbi:MAG: FkbM family methyltransferase, partial [Casimicrobiaceae bacterium]